MVRSVTLYPDCPTKLDIFRVEPFLYRVILLSRKEKAPHWPVDVLLGLISKKPPSFFGTSVHHLLIDDMEDFDLATLHTIASACCSVTDLFLNVSISPLLPVIHRLNSLRRLGISLEGLFCRAMFDFGHRAFANITHLEIFDQKAIDLSDKLSPLLNLTHLAFGFNGSLRTAARVLQNYPKLLYLIFVTVWMELERPDVQRCTALAEDGRFIVADRESFRDDWLLGAQSGMDFWARAEAFVAQRRAGKIDRKLLAIFLILLIDASLQVSRMSASK